MVTKEQYDRIWEALALIKQYDKTFYYSILTLNTSYVINDNVPVAATDGTVIYLNSEQLMKLPLPTLAFVIAHEYMHIFLDHITRFGSLGQIGNIVTDLHINSALIYKTFTQDTFLHNLIDGILLYYDEISSSTALELVEKENKFWVWKRPKGELPLKYISHIRDDIFEVPLRDQSAIDAMKDVEDKTGEELPDDATFRDAEKAIEKAVDNGTITEAEGKTLKDKIREIEEKVGNRTKQGLPAEPYESSEVSKIRERSKTVLSPTDIVDAVKKGKEMASRQAGIGTTSILDEILEMVATVDWRSVLRQFMTHQYFIDYDFKRKSRRAWAISADIYDESLTDIAAPDAVRDSVWLPALKVPEIKFLILVDASGSVGKEEFDQFIAEAKSISQTLEGSKVYVKFFTDHILEPKEPPIPIDKVEYRTEYGGTDFFDVIRYIAPLSNKYAGFIIMSDGGDKFPNIPEYFRVRTKLLWALVDEPSEFMEGVRTTNSRWVKVEVKKKTG